MSNSWGRGEEVEEAEDGQLEAEFAQLQLRYRLTHNAYYAYREEAKRKIAKQMMLVNRLELDNQEFETNLSKLETAHNKGKDQKNIVALSRLSGAEKAHQTAINEERAMIKKIAAQTAEMEGKIAEQRKNMGGTHKSTSKHNALSKCTTGLENRLYEEITLFNKQLATNSSLRSDIDHMRQERAVFDNLYRKLALELEHTRRKVSEVIRDSTEAFEHRDEGRNKTMALLEHSEKDKHQHEVEIRELQRLIHHDNRIREFMAIKASDRADLKAEEATKKDKILSAKLANADQTTIAQYEEALEHIYKVTGQRDLKAIVVNFEKNEEENFAIFNYVNEQNSEMEMLTEQVAAIKNDIAKFEQENQQLDASRQALMLKLEEKFNNERQTCDEASTKLRHVNKNMDQLLSSIDGIFKKISCDPKPILEMLGGDAGIVSKNAMIYLGQIEHRTSELLTAMAYLQKKKAELEGDLPAKPGEPRFPPAPNVPQVHISSPTGDDGAWTLPEEEEEEEIRPLTREELREQVMRKLSQRVQTSTVTAPIKTTTTKERKKTK